MTIKNGALEMNAIDGVLMYKRAIEGNTDSDIFVMVLNLTGNNKSINLSSSFSGLPQCLF